MSSNIWFPPHILIGQFSSTFWYIFYQFCCWLVVRDGAQIDFFCYIHVEFNVFQTCFVFPGNSYYFISLFSYISITFCRNQSATKSRHMFYFLLMICKFCLFKKHLRNCLLYFNHVWGCPFSNKLFFCFNELLFY